MAIGDISAIPPLVTLPRLLSAADNILNDEDSSEDLKLLLAPGSSLGGARPKASVIDRDGSLLIAKFPRQDDEFNAVAWEAVALSLAENCGVIVPKWRVESVANQKVLLINRFDRIGTRRIPFLSAMSMIDAQDNEQRSYLELADAIARYGAAPEIEMEQLWRRIIFNIMISNTDDHLRNHAFVYDQKGWRLSPAYDLNPTPTEVKSRILSTCIDLNDANASLDLAISVIEHFEVSKIRAAEIIRELGRGASLWRQTAAKFGITNQEINRMASAFEHADSKMALL